MWIQFLYRGEDKVLWSTENSILVHAYDSMDYNKKSEN